MKTKLFLLFSLLLLFLNSAYAQQKTTSLKIIIQSTTIDTFPNATIKLFAEKDSNNLANQLAKKSGNLFTVNQMSKYVISVSCIGYQSINKIVSVLDKIVEINILLKHTNTDLKNVVIKSVKKPLIKQDDDKTIIDATVIANSSVNAYEVLEKTPGAILDQDGNVYLSSMTPATIYINGRELKLSSADIASLLKSLPSSSINKIEILRNPSAKYDAASSGGIVNIVLKKGIKIGSNGSANLSYFQGIYSTKTVGVNFNNTSGKINTYCSFQYTSSKNYEDLITQRLIKSDSSLLKQKSFSLYPFKNYYISVGLGIAYSKNFNVDIDVRLTNNNSNNKANNDISIYKNDALLNIIGQNQSDIFNKNNSFNISNSISSKLKLDTIGSEWTNEINYNYYANNNNQNYINEYILPANPNLIGNGSNNNYKNIVVVQSDFILKKVNNITLETGLKSTTSNSNNAALYFYTPFVGSSSYVDEYQTNTFKYKETISAFYLQVAKSFLGFTLKPGLRVESTNIYGRQTIPKDTTILIKRTDIFPYVYLKHNLFKMFGFPLIANAIYRKSIKRPYYELLNPYPKYIDQYLFDVGNPKLKPQFTTNYELNISFNNFPVFFVGVNETNDVFNKVTYQNDLTKIAYRTYDNLGKNKEFYTRLIGGIPPGGKYFFYFGTQYNYNIYQGFYQNTALNYKRGTWLFFMFQELKATSNFTLNMQGFLRSKGFQDFYELQTFGGMYISANKSFLNKKATVIISVNDLLQTNHVSFNLNQGNIIANGTRVNDTRRLGIALRYNFGISKPKDTKMFGTAPLESTNN